jgi:hypothetical protein
MHDVYNIQYLGGTERIKVAKVTVKYDVYALLSFDLKVHDNSSSSCHTRYCLINYLSNITLRIRVRQKLTYYLGWDLEHRRLNDNDDRMQ